MRIRSARESLIRLLRERHDQAIEQLRLSWIELPPGLIGSEPAVAVGFGERLPSTWMCNEIAFELARIGIAQGGPSVKHVRQAFAFLASLARRQRRLLVSLSQVRSRAMSHVVSIQTPFVRQLHEARSRTR